MVGRAQLPSQQNPSSVVHDSMLGHERFQAQRRRMPVHPSTCHLGITPAGSCRHVPASATQPLVRPTPCLLPLQRNLWAALPQQSPEERMGDPSSFAITNIASLAG